MSDVKNITFEIVTDGNIEHCRDLCDELMAFQKSMAVIAPEQFDGMSFDTRLKKPLKGRRLTTLSSLKTTACPWVMFSQQ